MHRKQKPFLGSFFTPLGKHRQHGAPPLRMRVAWSVDGEYFSVPFNLSAHSQRLWITAHKDGLDHELHIKGTNWVCTCRTRRPA